MPLVSHRRGFYALYVSLIMFCEGAHFTLVPNVLKKIYGDQATPVFGLMFSFSGICSILLIFLQKWFITAETRSYNIFFLINGFLSLVSLIMLKFLFSEYKFKA